MGLFSKSDDDEVDLDDMDQAAFEKSFTKGSAQNSASPDYGVDKAIDLIRGLPQKDLASEIDIVTHTLESMNIDVKAIIADAEQKESRVSERIKFLKTEIDALSSKIKQHGDEISLCSTELGEVSAIKRLLQTEDSPAPAPVKKKNANLKDEQSDEGTVDSVALIDEETE